MTPTPSSSRTHLLLRLSSLGDLVLCTPLIAQLQRDCPQDEVAFATQTLLGNFARSTFPHPLTVIEIPRPTLGLLGWFLAGWKLANTFFLNRPSETIVYDLHGVLKTWALSTGFQMYAVWNKKKVEFRRTAKHSFLRWLSIGMGRDLLGPRHVFQEHLKLAPFHHPTPSSQPLTPRLRHANSAHKKGHILVASDATHWKKKWPASHWETFLGDLFKDTRIVQVTLVGSQKALPQDLIDDLESRHGSRLQNLLGKTRLEELPDIAADQELTICGNSAWLHISEAVGTPVISLAGPIVPGFGFSPWEPRSRELAIELDCRPCSRHGGGSCRKTGELFHACMKQITPAELLSAVQEILK